MSAGSGHHSLMGGAPHQVPGPRTQGAATGGQPLSATANQFVDKIDPFSKRGTSRRRRIVNSSRYHAENEPELVQLPLIKGEVNFVYALFENRRSCLGGRERGRNWA
ncbi:hypothetical protein COOONC_07400 [Cooperia oncophora]